MTFDVAEEDFTDFWVGIPIPIEAVTLTLIVKCHQVSSRHLHTILSVPIRSGNHRPNLVQDPIGLPQTSASSRRVKFDLKFRLDLGAARVETRHAEKVRGAVLIAWRSVSFGISAVDLPSVRQPRASKKLVP